MVHATIFCKIFLKEIKYENPLLPIPVFQHVSYIKILHLRVKASFTTTFIPSKYLSRSFFHNLLTIIITIELAAAFYSIR